ncbi:MAG: Protein serine/threonine phosphatase PrpC, regulation of stationary phase [uncultured Rubrobacteraceae bacterium]|uniref:Protein serine/threonine phosphatase PrpC, regulation of stationary phase n=1 Tax=uncultured Rubrobacteraceae bacterium TaxID=349277 RepID=A0A6J4QGB6_9ACTN|nr:MAG: Protein serine/threonine phosphatase PrpC, regulation of stationary phase [uncultured Rubrobacteraceae bacterium]
MPFLELQPFGVTDTGKVRQNNEDALLVGDGEDETLFVVADGIGGFEAGEVASSLAVDVLKDLQPDEPFKAAIGEANRRIVAAGRGDEKLSGMGTTVVAIRFGGTQGEPVAEVAHVGDSRAYLMRGGDMNPITEDHSLVAELVRSGDLTRDQAAEHPQKNLITRALGAGDEVDVDTTVLPIEAGDRILLCSDGLSDLVSEAGISEILAESPNDPERAARGLLSAALDAGGNDNITVVVVDVKEQPAREADVRERRERRSGGTSEMLALGPTGQVITPPTGKGDKSRPRRSTRAARRKRPRGFLKALGKFVRGLAIILVLIAALTPVYLWGSSRYFFEFDEGAVVAYQGLPYAPLGIELNQEWRRPGLTQSEIKEPYQKPIENHKLYTRDQAEQVLEDLGS